MTGLRRGERRADDGSATHDLHASHLSPCLPPISNGSTMPPIENGQTFPNLQAFKDALREWAVERNWTPHILDSDSHRVRAGCRSSADCPFRVRANYSHKRGDAKVTTCDDTHTCNPFRNNNSTLQHLAIKRAETGKLKFLLEAVPKLLNVTIDTHTSEIIEAVARKYGQKIPTRQAQKVKGGLVTRIKGPCRHCHQIGHTKRKCPQLRASAPGPNDYAGNDTMDFSNADQGSDNGAYADGGLDDSFDDDTTADPMGLNPSNGQPAAFPNVQSSQASMATADQTRPIGIPVNPILGAGSRTHDYGEILRVVQQQYPQTQNTQTQPVTQANGVQNNQNRTPSDTRLEASRLMQQAARLMNEAAKMNAEAARLTASVAHM